MFSIVVHPVFYHFATLLAFVAPISSRLSQLISLAPVCLGPPKNCKLPSRSLDVIVRESSELKKENQKIRQFGVDWAQVELAVVRSTKLSDLRAACLGYRHGTLFKNVHRWPRFRYGTSVVVYDSSGCCVDSSVDDYRPDLRLRVVLDGCVGAVPPPSGCQRQLGQLRWSSERFYGP